MQKPGPGVNLGWKLEGLRGWEGCSSRRVSAVHARPFIHGDGVCANDPRVEKMVTAQMGQSAAGVPPTTLVRGEGGLASSW